MKRICKGLKSLREERFMTQAELAKEAGMVIRTVWCAENNCEVSSRTVKKLATALKVKPERILNEP